MSTILGREAILAAPDIKTEQVAVPEWGGTVLVRGMTGAERDEYEATLVVGKGKNRDVNMRNARAKLVVRCLVDADGKRLFGDADVAALGKKSATALERVFDVARRLSGMSDEDLEELMGNLPGQSDGSGSD
jgi:hypothetical protein